MSVSICVDAQQMKEEDVLVLQQTGPQSVVGLC